MNSYLEASNAGKPIIGVPIFADQYYNLGCAIRKGFALYVDKTNLTSDAFRTAINEILTVPRFLLKSHEFNNSSLILATLIKLKSSQQC